MGTIQKIRDTDIPELQLCNEGRDGPARHKSDFVLSFPNWNKPRAFCQQHLEQEARESELVLTAWNEYKRNRGNG